MVDGWEESRILKFGGTSLVTPPSVRRAAMTVAAVASAGHPTVVVVSVRGNTTDELLDEARSLRSVPNPREMDQLLTTGETASAALLTMSLHELGLPAVSLTGAQIGIVTEGSYGDGRINRIDHTRIAEDLRAGQIVVVAGYHGVDEQGNVVTLGRGGSDTSAVALAAALGARHCEIYTDVDGVFTADPRIVADPRLISTVDSAGMAELAFAGAKVLHTRSVELASSSGVDIHVRNSAFDRPGTLVAASPDGGSMLEPDATPVGVAQDFSAVRIVVAAEPPSDDCTAEVLEALGRHAIPADIVVRSGSAPAGFALDFTVSRDHLEAVREILVSLGRSPEIEAPVAKVSLIGTSLLDRTDYTARVLVSLATAGVPVHSVTTSRLRTSVTVPVEQGAAAVRVLHGEFDLNRQDAADQQMATL